MRRREVFRLALGLVAAAFIASGCLSPTLPLPPPEEPDSIQPSAEDADVWFISGTCEPGARVEVINDRTLTGGLAVDDELTGRYTIELLHAKRCDRAVVSQTIGSEASGETGFLIQERTAAGVADPSACK